jgi:predicted transcriptional regulator of viral defense system
VCFFDKTIVPKRSQSIDDKVIQSINARADASVFSTKDFIAFGNAPAVGQALARLAKAGTLLRVRQGLYYLRAVAEEHAHA